MKMFWQVRKRDYESELVFRVRFRKQTGDEELPTTGDLLDVVINQIAPKIREGKTEGSSQIRCLTDADRVHVNG